MSMMESDSRNLNRRARDEAIAAEPKLPALDLRADAPMSPLESHVGQRRRRPVALAGIVENGLVRLVDPGAKLPEHSRVIVVAESA